tara:strand:+ start:4163 stop:5056 length:894 start_codon:yes stop_codon:yes gene_type:complete
MIYTFFSPNARLANQVLQSIGYSIIGEKLNIKVDKYSSYHEIEKLNISYWREGRILKKTNDLKVYSNSDLRNIMNGLCNPDESFCFDGNFQVGWFLKENELKIKKMFDFENVKSFSENQYLIFLRLGDVAHLSPPFQYYRKAIELVLKKTSNKKLSNNKSNICQNYLTTDSPNHPLVKKIIKRYNLELIDYDPVETLLFARKFQNLILTGGSFNWLAAFLSSASLVIYPESTYEWSGDIFSPFPWKCLSWKEDARLRYFILNNYFEYYDSIVLFKRSIRSLIAKFLKRIYFQFKSIF